MRGRHLLLCSLAWIVLPACADRPGAESTPEVPEATKASVTATSDSPLIIFLGNSLTAGYGLSEEQAFPAVLAGRLEAAGNPVRVVNAGISGDTTAGGLSRLEWLLSQGPEIVVVELGANDGLRGLSLAQTESNLDQIIRRCTDRGVRVLLVGMKIPPSYGADYSGGFEEMFPRLARKHGVDLVPFLLAGVAANPRFNQADAIHPNAEGQQRIAGNLQPHIERLLQVR
jgi:acyl-CoA thioesterase-1